MCTAWSLAKTQGTLVHISELFLFKDPSAWKSLVSSSSPFLFVLFPQWDPWPLGSIPVCLSAENHWDSPASTEVGLFSRISALWDCQPRLYTLSSYVLFYFLLWESNSSIYWSVVAGTGSSPTINIFLLCDKWPQWYYMYQRINIGIVIAK